jgi:hypothetical protein
MSIDNYIKGKNSFQTLISHPIFGGLSALLTATYHLSVRIDSSYRYDFSTLHIS